MAEDAPLPHDELRRDRIHLVEQVIAELPSDDRIVEPIDWNVDNGFAETVADLPPYGRGEPHIRIKIGAFDCTSIGCRADLPRILIDRDGRQHHASLPFGDTLDSAIRDLRDLARREVHPMLAALVAATPQPFLQTIVDVAPTRTVFGRVCLLGDAAFVVRPHTAGATAKAARDATTLARALKRAGRNVDAGLSGFEEMQIEFGQGLVDYGVALGRRWAA
jgi:hypothetical protein